MSFRLKRRPHAAIGLLALALCACSYSDGVIRNIQLEL
jgi:hypothetical protein